MTRVSWYFDFLSPFSYFALDGLKRLPPGTEVRRVPVLLAGLLKHWGQKGPAEVAPKRLWTYRSCVWIAKQHGLPFRLPAAHPFNPLPYLRLAIAAGNSEAAIRAIFEALWTTGADPSDPAIALRLGERFDVTPERLLEDSVKTALRDNTDAAIRAGVFGVPSLVVDGQVFWGSDALDFALAYLADPRIFDWPDMKRAASLPVAASRAAAG